MSKQPFTKLIIDTPTPDTLEVFEPEIRNGEIVIEFLLTSAGKSASVVLDKEKLRALLDE